jgi:hypothetical protein
VLLGGEIALRVLEVLGSGGKAEERRGKKEKVEVNPVVVPLDGSCCWSEWTSMLEER